LISVFDDPEIALLCVVATVDDAVGIGNESGGKDRAGTA
jgi:hypothetical protein